VEKFEQITEDDCQGYLGNMNAGTASYFLRQLQLAAALPEDKKKKSMELLRLVACQALSEIQGEGNEEDLEDFFSQGCQLVAYESYLIGPLVELVNTENFSWEDAQEVLKLLRSYQQPPSVTLTKDQLALSSEITEPIMKILAFKATKTGKVTGGLDSGVWNKLKTLIVQYDNSNKKTVEFEISLSTDFLVLQNYDINKQNEVNGYLSTAEKMVQALSNLCRFTLGLLENKGNVVTLWNSGFIQLLQGAASNPCNNGLARQLLECLNNISKL